MKHNNPERSKKSCKTVWVKRILLEKNEDKSWDNDVKSSSFENVSSISSDVLSDQMSKEDELIQKKLDSLAEEEKKAKRRRQNAKVMYYLGVFSRLCVAMPICIMVGYFAGRFLDSKLNTSPVFLIMFLILGVISSYVTLFKSKK